MKYTATFFGKTREVSGRTFALVSLGAFAVLIMSLVGLYQISGWLLLAWMILGSALTIDGKRHALIPNRTAQKWFNNAVILTGLGYFFFHYFVK